MSPDFRHRRGHKLHYVEQGDGDHIVFAHGYVMDHTMYAAQFEELPKNYHCVAWDMRGHGHSDTPDGPWTIDDLVADLAEFIEGVASPCHLVGMSLGGMTAVRVALDRPDLVRSLTMIDSSADALPAESVDDYHGFLRSIERDDGLTDELARSTLPLFYGQPYMDANPDAMTYHVDRATSMSQEALYEGLRVLTERGSVVDRLAEIKVPTLVIHGELDLAIEMKFGEQVANGVPGAKLVKIPGAGHSTPIEAPDAVNEALSLFVAG